ATSPVQPAPTRSLAIGSGAPLPRRMIHAQQGGTGAASDGVRPRASAISASLQGGAAGADPVSPVRNLTRPGRNGLSGQPVQPILRPARRRHRAGSLRIEALCLNRNVAAEA